MTCLFIVVGVFPRSMFGLQLVAVSLIKTVIKSKMFFNTQEVKRQRLLDDNDDEKNTVEDTGNER